MVTPRTLDPRTDTVHDLLRSHAGAADVFRHFGIDTCCGGELPLELAAEHHGVDLDSLVEALADARAGG